LNSSHAETEDRRRIFAVDVVRRLRNKGHEALWAGGCVRDQLLGKLPKDYDVASTATPDEVIQIFGRRRTVPVGASFGVVMVLGPDKAAGQIEVATFRSDGEYLDGRRPSSVSFCRPEEDAQRRDFTINGMFFDPLEQKFIDYVGGLDDLAAGIVRAIGDPIARFTEDKLRMLRAVRFTATFGFDLDAATADAVHQLRHQIRQVSEERVTQELKRMLSHASRELSLRLLHESGLLAEILPEVFGTAGSISDSTSVATICQQLKFLESDEFETALMLVLLPLRQTDIPGKSTGQIDAVCRRLKLSNEETECICWLAESLSVLEGISGKPLHVLKPLLAHPYSERLLHASTAIAAGEGRLAHDVQFCRAYLSQVNRQDLCPAPFVNGQDLMALNVPQGPEFRVLLTTIRNEQLDEILTTRTAALVRLSELVNARTVG
jgi:poly(A) polymerase